MLLYYITSRKQFASDEASRRSQLLSRIEEASQVGIDYIQLRERDLSARELEIFATQVTQKIKAIGSRTKLLINSRTDIAIAVGADGVHLRSDDISASEARTIFSKAGIANPVVAVSCHSTAEITSAAAHGADFVVLGPVFEKRDTTVSAVGIDALKAGAPLPVFALGGITIENAALCRRAGAIGIAAIRLFQNGNLAETVKRLQES